MAQQNWQEVEFAGALGMATNVADPGQKFAKRLLNVHTHEQPGKIKLRSGYELKYPAPSDSTITESSFLTFEMFMDKQADPAGKEITCLIQQGIIQPVSGSGILNTQQEALCFWIRPYWDGNVWIDNWQWLNKVLITKITTASDIIFHNVIGVSGNSVQGLNNLVGWTIYNKTKGEYAKVITSKADGLNTKICHTLYNNSWALEDVIFLMRNYYDLDCLKEIHNCEWTDIVFHKINNDLRIGFGGQKNRKGISIGYRKKYLLLEKFNFTNKYEDLTDDALSAFRETDGFVLDEFTTNTSGFGINLIAVKGSLKAGKYNFRLTALQDNYEEMLVVENSIIVDGTKDVQLNPYITLGRNSSRITGLRLYASKANDDITFYKISEYTLTQNSLNDSGSVAYALSWTINNAGQVILSTSLNAAGTTSSDELFTEENVTNIANESNKIGSWGSLNGQITPTFQILVYDSHTDTNIDISTGISYKTGNYYYGNEGDPNESPDNTNIITEDYIPVLQETVYQYKTTNGLLLNGQYIVFYKADKSFLSAVTPDQDVNAYDFTTPTDTVYLRTGVHATFSEEILSIDSPGVNDSSYSLKVQINTGSGCLFPMSMDKSKTFIIDFFIKALALQNGANVAEGITYSTFQLTWIDPDNNRNTQTYYAYQSLDFIPVKPNTKYKYSASYGFLSSDSQIISQITPNGSNICIFDKEGNLIDTKNPTTDSATLDFTTPAAAAYIQALTFTLDDSIIPTFQILYEDSNLTANADLIIYDESKNIMDFAPINNIPTSFTEYTKSLNPRYASEGTPSFIGIRSLATNVTFWIDKISVKASDTFFYSSSTDLKDEMKDVLGYTAGDSLVNGWDQAIVFRGRTYFLNPYVDQRYEGFIYVSIINAANAFMYDIATADNWKPLDRFSSYKAIGMILLPTMELLILMNNCITAIDPDTGVARNPVYDIGCVARNTIVNVNGIIFWCDDEDIYMLNIGEGLNPKAILVETIRDLYRDIADKGKLFCVRDKYNTYRVRVFDTIKKIEYLLNKNGWIEEEKHDYPEIYRVSANTKLDFLSAGNIYEIKDS